VAHGDDACGDVLGDHRAGADDGVVADGHPRADDDSAAEPDVVADGDGQRGLQLVAAGPRFHGVRGGEELDVGSDLAVLADGDPGDVQCGQVVVDEGAGADGEVAAVVDVQGRAYVDAVTGGGEELGEDRPGFVGVLEV